MLHDGAPEKQPPDSSFTQGKQTNRDLKSTAIFDSPTALKPSTMGVEKVDTISDGRLMADHIRCDLPDELDNCIHSVNVILLN